MSNINVKRLISKISFTTGCNVTATSLPCRARASFAAIMRMRSPALLMYSSCDNSKTTLSPPAPEFARYGSREALNSSAF